MKTINIIKKRGDGFAEKMSIFGYNEGGLGDWIIPTKEAEEHFKEENIKTLIAIFEGEIERLEKQVEIWQYHELGAGYRRCAEDQITHYKQLIEELK